MTTTKAREQSVTVNGLRLRYFAWGVTGKPPLVCLHGFSEQAHIFDEFAEAASRSYHVYALDFRGHGRSQWAKDGYTRDLYVADTAAFLDALGLRQTTLVGLSLGGMVGMHYAAAHPDRVARLVMVDIGPESGPRTSEQRGTRPPRPMELESLEDAFTWARTGPWHQCTDERLRKDLRDKMRRREDGKWAWLADPELFKPSGAPPSPEAIAENWAALRAVRCPVLVVRGKKSFFVSDDILERMKRENTNVASVDVDGAAHIVTIDNPQGFIQATASFLGTAG